MDDRIDYQTHPTLYRPEQGVSYTFNFDAIEPACPGKGRLFPRFFFTYRQPAAVIPAIRLWLQDPRPGYDAAQILLYSGVDVPLDATESEASVVYDCCCTGRSVPFALGEGPLPRYLLRCEAVAAGGAEPEGAVIVLETWWCHNVAPSTIGTRGHNPGGAFG